MTFEKMKALQRLATEQGIELRTIREFAIFANTAKL